MQAKIKTAPEGADGDLSPCVITKFVTYVCKLLFGAL